MVWMKKLAQHNGFTNKSHNQIKDIMMVGSNKETIIKVKTPR